MGEYGETTEDYDENDRTNGSQNNSLAQARQKLKSRNLNSSAYKTNSIFGSTNISTKSPKI